MCPTPVHVIVCAATLLCAGIPIAGEPLGLRDVAVEAPTQRQLTATFKGAHCGHSQWACRSVGTHLWSRSSSRPTDRPPAYPLSAQVQMAGTLGA